ncbi:molybdopterin synthase [Halomarina ordinaria]|uniref:Molybdopterin synthase n=1 Tax=Halomarina ordinaria TaxID=3033939 RepID=A0ABD5U6N5_9EURY|nr:molybdopterin synthase [Halomarina sp. PSRA2]
MYTVAVVGAESTVLTERLVSRLARSGRVATVSSLPTDPDPGFEAGDDLRAAGAGTVVGLGPEGTTTRSGARTLGETLDDLAPSATYCVVDGVEGTGLPTVVAGEGDADDPLARVERAADADLDALVAAIEGTEPHETLGSLVARVKRSPHADRSGAIATFTGRVRAKDGDDDPRTELLEFETYEEVAEGRMEAISRELEEREGVFEVRMHHRTGVIPDGEDIVFVVVLAGHRGEAFRTVEDGIDRLKAEVPIFKREVTVDEEFWVHERQ